MHSHYSGDWRGPSERNGSCKVSAPNIYQERHLYICYFHLKNRKQISERGYFCSLSTNNSYSVLKVLFMFLNLYASCFTVSVSVLLSFNLFCSQVTYQTKQLTTEFEKQSQYIVCLLAELQQKDSVLLSLEEELQHCKEELEPFRSQKEKEENNVTFEGEKQQKQAGQEERSPETFELCPSDKKVQITCDPDRLTPVIDNEKSWSCEQGAESVELDKTRQSPDRVEAEFSQGGATADVAAALPALQQNKQLSQQEISDFTSEDRQGMHTEKPQEERSQHQDRPQDQSPKTAALLCSAEPRSPSRPHDITAEEEMQLEGSSAPEKRSLEWEDEAVEGETKAACEPEINRLEEQVWHESLPLPGHAFVIVF